LILPPGAIIEDTARPVKHVALLRAAVPPSGHAERIGVAPLLPSRP
jgi:hypothetical protein